MQKESALRLLLDHIWYRIADRNLDGVGIFLLFDRCWNHGIGFLVHQQKIININLSAGEYTVSDPFSVIRSDPNGINISKNGLFLPA